MGFMGFPKRSLDAWMTAPIVRILTYENGNSYNKIEQVKTEKLDSDSIMMLYYSLDEYYSKNASFLMNRSTLNNIIY